MKKAKIALTAVAVLAVVGGALAFKASRGEFVSAFTAKASNNTLYCSQPVNITDATTDNAGPAFTTRATLVAVPVTQPGPCPIITLYSVL